MATQLRRRATKQVDQTPPWAIEAVSTLPAIAKIAEVSAAIRMCPRTIRRLVETGQLRAVKAREAGSARLLFPRTEVARYLASLGGGAP